MEQKRDNQPQEDMVPNQPSGEDAIDRVTAELSMEASHGAEEVPADAQDALALEEAVVTADALHTQQETARYLVEDKKADYLFIVKDNQPTLRQDIAALELKSFPPSAHNHR